MILRANNPQRGQAVISVVLLFLIIASTVVFGTARSVFHRLKSNLDFNSSRGSYYLAESLLEDTTYRFIKSMSIPVVPTLTMNGSTAVGTITDIVGGKEIVVYGDWGGLKRNARLRLSYGAGGSFFYGVQAGEGGVTMANSSSIHGNISSDGPISGSGNMVYGDVLSAGPTGLIDKIHATSSAYAHTIQNSTVDKDAFYTVLTSTSVGGVSHPGSPDQATSSLPITDSQIDGWESDAAAGGTVTCTSGQYIINANVTIGPKKIPCNLVISGNPTVTLSGALWATGNITIQNNPILKVSSAFLNRTIPVVADNQSDRLNSSYIDFQNASSFQGSGTNSYILFISRNTSAENGGAVDAISAGQSLTGEVLIYAPHGNVSLSNSVSLREVTAYKLSLKNSAEIFYKSGLASLLFASGPSGGYDIYNWREVQ